MFIYAHIFIFGLFYKMENVIFQVEILVNSCLFELLIFYLSAQYGGMSSTCPSTVSSLSSFLLLSYS